MKNADGALEFDVILKTMDLQRQIQEVERRIMGMTTNTVRETSKMDTAFQKLGLGIAGYFSFQAMRNFTAEIINVRGEFQQLEVAFNTMLKSKQKADALMSDVVQFAATTPFNLTEVAKSAKHLLAYGSVAENITDELRMLGDVASGVSAPIGDLVYLYGTLRTQGRAYTRDILQFTSRGIPIISELAKQMGVAESAVQGLVESGKVGFPQVEQAFKAMTSQGGMFNNLMAAQTKTLAGQMSNLKDAFDQMLNGIGKDTQGIISSGIKGVATLIQNYEKVGKAILVIVSTYGAYKAALIATTLLQRANVAILRQAVLEKRLAAAAGIALSAAEAKQAATSKLLSAAHLKQTISQLKLNAAILANPYVAATAALVGLGVALYAFANRTTAAEAAQKKFNEAMEEAGNKRGEQISQAEEHIRIIKDETATIFSQLKAREELIRSYPELFKSMSLEEIKLLSLEEAQKRLNAANDQREIKDAVEYYQAQQKEVERLTAFINQLQQTQSEHSGFVLAQYSRQLVIANEGLRQAREKVEELRRLERESKPLEVRLKYYEDQKRLLQEQIDKVKQMKTDSSALSFIWKDLNDEIKRIDLGILQGELDKVNKKIAELVPDQKVKTVNDRISELRKSLIEEEEGLKELRKGSSLLNIDNIQSAEERLELIVDELKTLGVDTAKVTPFGSLKYWEEIAKRAEEAMSITPADNVKEIKRQQEIRLNAEKKAEEIRRSLAVRSFDEELDYKKKQYDLYQKWIDFTNKQTADEQFSSLIKDGEGYIDYLQRQIEQVRSKIENKTASETEKERFQILNIELTEAKGGKSAIDVFKEKLEAAKKEAGSLTDYLETLKKKQAELDGSKTDFGMKAREIVASQIREVEEESAANLKAYTDKLIESYQSYAAKRAELDKQYKSDADALNKQISAAATEAERQRLQEVLKLREKAYKEDLQRINDEEVMRGDSYKRLHDQAIKYSRKELKARIEIIKMILAGNKEISDELKKQLLELLKETEDAIWKKTAANMREIANGLGEVATALEGANDSLAYTVSQLGKAVDALADTAEGAVKLYEGDPSGIFDLIKGIGKLITIGKQTKEMNREAREETKKFYEEAERGEMRYQALLRQREREQAKAGKSTYRGLIDELELLKSQSTEVQAAYDKVFKALQGEEFISGAGYKHGTWFRKAKTWDIMASLAGSDYERLEKLYEQGKLKDTAKEDFEALKKLREELEASGVDILKLQEELSNLLTGTNSSQLSDTLIELFKNGKMAAKDFGDSFEDIMKTSLQNIFKYKYLEDQMKPFQDALFDLVNEGTPTEREIAELEQMYVQIGERAADYWKVLEDVTGVSFKDTTKNATLSGAIKGMDQQTANVLAGQANAMRVNQVEHINLTKGIIGELAGFRQEQIRTHNLVNQSLIHLSEIAANTRYNRHLEKLDSIDNQLKALNSKDPLRASGLG